jgi:hypothetical protein
MKSLPLPLILANAIESMGIRDPLPQSGQAGTEFVTILLSENIFNYEMR